MGEIVIFGTGPAARMAAYYLTNDSEHTVVAFVGSEAIPGTSSPAADVTMISTAEARTEYPPETHGALVAMELDRSNRERERGFEHARSMGYDLITYVSSSATVSREARIGSNCMILERCVVQPWAVLGDDVVLSPGCHIGHESALDDHCYLEARVVISGNVEIGPRTYIGANAAVRNSVVLGGGVAVEAGATVSKSVPDEHAWVTQRGPAGADSSPSARHR